ncbi:hypothetical protein BgiMline_004713 [Biomphalaria glabrata]|nr:hypothetical protein BgiMline_002814 [Biomphalaria glabrata]
MSICPCVEFRSIISFSLLRRLARKEVAKNETCLSHQEDQTVERAGYLTQGFLRWTTAASSMIEGVQASLFFCKLKIHHGKTYRTTN